MLTSITYSGKDSGMMDNPLVGTLLVFLGLMFGGLILAIASLPVLVFMSWLGLL